jgi:hypothetical protein
MLLRWLFVPALGWAKGAISNPEVTALFDAGLCRRLPGQDRRARWLAAATLDRYLQKVGQPQVFGTQYRRAGTPNAPWTMDPYDDQLPDSLRAIYCTPDRAESHHRLELLRQDKPLPPSMPAEP